MSNEQRQQQRPAEAMPSDDDFQRLLERDAKTTASYIPYGAKDEIRLTVTTVQNLIAVRTKRGHTCSHRDALKFIAMCKAKRLNPFEGDCFLIGYDGADGPTFALVTAHQTYLKRAELHEEFDGMASGLIVKDDGEDGKLSEIEGDFYESGQRVVGGWAKVYFKNRKHPMYKRLRMERFNSGFAQWKVDAAGMICKCAEADALRSAFPTMLGGLYMEDEKQPEVKMAKPDFSKPAATPLFGKAPDTTTAPEPELEPPPEEPAFTDTGEGTDLGTQVPTQSAQPASNGQPNYLKGVRGLLKMSNIKESTLLGFWSGTGSTDGSQSTLEEVQMTSPDVMRLTYEQWQDISGRILAAQKAGGK